MLTSVCLETGLALTQDSCSVCADHTISSHFLCTRWNSQVTWVMWNLIIVYLETALVLVQDRCTVCTKRIKGLEILLDALDATSR
jgi:hypothetical protein